MRKTRLENWFPDPKSTSHVANAPTLVFEFNQGSVLLLRIHCHMNILFDAVVLFVYQIASNYAKLCLEHTTGGHPTLVSVVTNEFFDDANVPTFHSTQVNFPVSRSESVLASHHTAQKQRMKITSFFRIAHPSAQTWVGFLAQAPVGNSLF